MKIYCSSCDKVQPVRIDNCRDAKTNEPFQDIVCAECDLVIASGTDIAKPEQEPVAGEPLPCPFCGNSGLDFDEGSTHRWGIASCSGCGASCGEIRREYPDKGEWHKEAIAEWNRRASPPAQRKPLPPHSPCEMTQAEGKMFKLGWLECEAAHGIKEKA